MSESQGAAKPNVVKLQDSFDAIIDPATEETLQLIASGIGASTTIADGRKTVTSAGTAEKLIASSTPCSKVIIMALVSNTDIVVVGASTVVAANGTRRGIALIALSSIEIQINDVSKIYLDAVVSGEGVSFIYLV